MTASHTQPVFLGLGGNQDDPLAHFRQARQCLENQAGIAVTAASPIYLTPPVGGPGNQPDYLNAVLQIRTTLSPLQLLSFCQGLENEAGRTRDLFWGPRTLDIDLLLFDNIRMTTRQLVLPHPRLHLRHFVLIPLHDLAADAEHPRLQRSIRQLLDTLPPAEGIRRHQEQW